MKSIAVVLAAGKGTRLGADTKKQYIILEDQPILYYSLKVFEESIVDEIILVLPEEDIESCRREFPRLGEFSKLSDIVAGGSERYLSVKNALDSISGDYDIVLIHDAARPFIDKELVEEAVNEANKHKAYIPALALKDTIKVKDSKGFVESTLDRSSLVAVQTPQAFDFKLCKEAYEKLGELGVKDIPTDDEMLVSKFMSVSAKIGEGRVYNIKITSKEDIYVAKAILEYRRELQV